MKALPIIFALVLAYNCLETPSKLLKSTERNLSLNVESETKSNDRKLFLGDMLKSDAKTEQTYHLSDQLYQMDEEMKLYDRDAQDLESLNGRVDDLRNRIGKVLDSVKGKIDFARARLMTLG